MPSRRGDGVRGPVRHKLATLSEGTWRNVRRLGTRRPATLTGEDASGALRLFHVTRDGSGRRRGVLGHVRRHSWRRRKASPLGQVRSCPEMSKLVQGIRVQVQFTRKGVRVRVQFTRIDVLSRHEGPCSGQETLVAGQNIPEDVTRVRDNQCLPRKAPSEPS